MTEKIAYSCVIVHRCLVDKPIHSGTSYGWIVEGGIYNPSKTELCGAIGLATSFEDENGVIAVSFISKWPVEVGESYEHTLLYALASDCEVTDEPYTWPTQDGQTILRNSR
jgi:hypothetical protein